MENLNHQTAKLDDIWKPLVDDLDRKHVTKEDIGNVFKHEGLRSDIVSTITKARSVARDLRPIEVDYRRPLKKMIEAAGIRIASNDINEKIFPKEKNDCVSIVYAFPMPIDRPMSSTEILDKFSSMHCRPGTLPELLAYAEKHLDVPILPFFPHVALGSVRKQRKGKWCHKTVPIVRSFNLELRLNTSPFDLTWKGKFLFLAVFES